MRTSGPRRYIRRNKASRTHRVRHFRTTGMIWHSRLNGDRLSARTFHHGSREGLCCALSVIPFTPALMYQTRNYLAHQHAGNSTSEGLDCAHDACYLSDLLVFLLTALIAPLPLPVLQALALAGIADTSWVSTCTKSARRTALCAPAEQPLNPASVMKLGTTYAGLELLGPS